MAELFKHEFQRETDMDEDGTQPVMPIFTRSTKKREQSTLQKWVQCTRCKKWRRVPFQLKDGDLGENWECKDNAWDAQFSSCKVPQALSDEQIDAILDACQESEDDMDDDGNDDRVHHTDGLPISFQASLPDALEGLGSILPKHIEDVGGTFPRTITRRIPAGDVSSSVRTSSRIKDRITNILAPESISSALKHSPAGGTRVKDMARALSVRGRASLGKSPRDKKTGKIAKSVRNGAQDINDVVEALLGANGNYLYSSLGDPGFRPSNMGTESAHMKGCRFSPGRIVWGKVDGHDWWPALVVRRRSVPSEVGPPPGGVSEVMTYTPVVFFTPKGIPKEVELGMDSVEFPIAMCRRACGEVDEDEAEYAWLSQDKIRAFLRGQNTGRNDGIAGTDLVLRDSVAAAHRALAKSSHPSPAWSTDEDDSDGGWACAAGLIGGNSGKSRSHKKKHNKSKGHNKKKTKCDEDGGSDGDSGDGGQEWLSYGSWLPQPKIVVEHIHAWRHPQMRQEREKEREIERRGTHRRLRQLAALQRAIDHGLHPAECLACVVNVSDDAEDMDELPSHLTTRQPSQDIMPENFASENLRQEEREAVSTLLGFSENPAHFMSTPFSSAAQEPQGRGEPEYFVKYANRSHMYNEWVNESTLYKIAKRKLVNFKRRYGDGPVNMFLEEWAEPERLVTRRKCRVGPGWELLVKWKELGYEHCTWEVENCRMLSKPEAVTLYLALWDRQRKSFQRSSPSAKKLAQEIKLMAADGITPIQGQPAWVRGSRLLPHQIDSLNWFRQKWLCSKPGILIGNAGLGKTACAISFIQSLREELMTTGPILVVVPNGQLDRWSGEVAFWSGGQIDCVIYQGPSAARSIIWDYEIWQAAECVDGNIPCHETRKIPRAEVVLTSYENMTADFSQVPWSLVVLDCRGGSKGSIARMVTMLCGIDAMHLLLASQLPDTPGGLTSMLKFINAQTENDVDDSMSNDSGSEEENLVLNLQQVLSQHAFKVSRPHEEDSLSRFREFMVPFKFTPEQEDSFRRTLAKHYEVLTDQSIPRHSSQNVGSFRRIVQDLCQVCHHPFLLDDDPEDLENSTCTSLLRASGKLQILNHILDCVHVKGCRALVLTQTTKMSDLLSHFLMLRFGQNAYERAIPSDSTLVQHQSIQKFLKSTSPFVFLATPDTCGLGMCLPCVNLVVVYDSSPDPSNELLAAGRARKIGSSSELPIIRLFAENSVEEKVLHLAERRENGLEALLGAVHTRGTAADSKLLEDILICGSQLAFSNHMSITLENRDDMNMDNKTEGFCTNLPAEPLGGGPHDTSTQKIGPDDVMHIVNKVLTIRDGPETACEKFGKLEVGGAVVRWCVRGINLENGIVKPGINDLSSSDELLYDVPIEGGSCSTYWENLVKHTWDGLKREEKIRQEKIRPVLEASDNEDESGDPLDMEGTPRATEETLRKSKSNSIKASSRRKRTQDMNDMEVDETVGSRKRRKSARPLTDVAPHQHRDIFFRRNGNGHWTRDSLLNSKAQQDVLMRVISDPSTLEGQAAKRAFSRIDQIADDLRLPMNVVLMARQIAEVLLTMREESDQGAYFQDYTLVVLVAFAAHLGNLDLGEKYGLVVLAQKYGQDLAAMEQVFVHIARIMQEYKETMLKIKGLDGNAGAIATVEDRKEACAPSPTAAIKQESAAPAPAHAIGKEKEGAFLHKELDHFLNRWSEVLEADHRPQVDVPHSALSEPPGASIKGQTPSYQWYLANSAPSSPELVDLLRQARACDVEIFVIEKAHALKYKAIEKVVLDFQEKVREYGLKALEEVKGQALRMSQQVVTRQASIQSSLASLSVQLPQTANGISGPQSTYQYIMRALQGGAAQASLASLPLASSSLTPSLHPAPVVHTKPMDHAINLAPTCTPVSSVAARPPAAAPPPPPSGSAPQATTSQGQLSLESLHLAQKNISGGVPHPVAQPAIAPQAAGSQPWRGFVPPGTAPVPNSQNVKAIERLLLATLNPCQVQQGDRSQQGRIFPRVQNVSNQQVLLQQLQQPQQAHVQRLLQDQSLNPMVKPAGVNYSPRQPGPTIAPHSGAVNLTPPPASLQQPPVSGVRPGVVPSQPLASSVQIPASFGAALSSLIPQYTSFRVVSQSGAAPASSVSGTVPQAEPAAMSNAPRNTTQHHAHNAQTSMSFVHGTARVIHEKPPAIHLEPAQAARVVLSHPGTGRPANSAPEALQPAIADSGVRSVPAVATAHTAPTISSGDLPALPQGPGAKPPGLVGATITTGSGITGGAGADARENGTAGHQSTSDMNTSMAAKQGSVVTTGTDPGMELAPSGSVTSFPKGLGAAGYQPSVPHAVQVPPLPTGVSDLSRPDTQPAATQSAFYTPLRFDKAPGGDTPHNGASQQTRIEGFKSESTVVPSMGQSQSDLSEKPAQNDSLKSAVSGFEVKQVEVPRSADQGAQEKQMEDALTETDGQWKE